MVIVNINDEVVSGTCFYFEYEGFTISYTQIMKPYHVMIIKENGDFLTDEKFNSITDAIEYINKHKKPTLKAVFEKIIDTLDEEELSILCDSYDDGNIHDYIDMFLEQDMKNKPFKYDSGTHQQIKEEL